MAKKLKKLKNIVVAPIQAKIGWKRLRKRKNKNYHSVSIIPFRSYSTRYKKFQRKGKKFKKIKNIIMASFQAKVGWKSPRMEENKNFRSYPACNRKFQKNSKRVVKIKKNQ